jgi:hypothetical protein
MNTVKQKEETPEQRPGPGDYYEVNSRLGTWYVSPESAARISRALDRDRPKAWLKFVDLNGSRVWVRSTQIESIAESTERQRTSERDFQYLRRKEDRGARRWDDDEY